jgi:hypothetical protein
MVLLQSFQDLIKQPRYILGEILDPSSQSFKFPEEPKLFQRHAKVERFINPWMRQQRCQLPIVQLAPPLTQQGLHDPSLLVHV